MQNFVKYFEQETLSFQDLELSMNPCLVGSKYIKMHTFEQGKSFNPIEVTFLNKIQKEIRTCRKSNWKNKNEMKLDVKRIR